MNVSLPEFLSEENSLGVFLLITVAIGGGAAFLTGRAIAASWRPWWHAAGYALLLALAVRFFHFALFQGTLLSPRYYAVDAAVCVLAALLSYRLMRVRQMVTAYGWVNERVTLLWWRRRPPLDSTQGPNPG